MTRCLLCKGLIPERGRSYCRSCIPTTSQMRLGWAKLRRVVLARDGGKCVLCGSSERVDVDHIVPRGNGGGDVLSNLRVVCSSFNQGGRCK